MSILVFLSLLATAATAADFDQGKLQHALAQAEPPGISHLTLLDEQRGAWMVHGGGALSLRVGDLTDMPDGQDRARFEEALIRGLRRVPEGLVLHLNDGAGLDTLWFVNEQRPGRRKLGQWNGPSGMDVLGLGADGDLQIAHDQRKPFAPDVWSLDLDNGQTRLQERNPGRILSWGLDRQGVLRLAKRWQPSGRGLNYQLLHRGRPGIPFRIIAEHGLDEPALRSFGFAPGDRTLYVARELPSQDQVLQVLDPITRRYGEPLYRSGDRRIRSLRHDQGGAELALVSVEGDRPGLHLTQARWREALAALEEAFPQARLDLLAAQDDGSSVWRVESDLGAFQYVQSRGDGAVRPLGAAYPEQSGSRAGMRPFRFSARDGLELSAYVTGLSGPDSPAVVLVHGGPWARDRWGYHREAQFLAALGYTVIQVNYRGSAGVGHELLEAGRRQWGQAMQDDLVDAVRHAAAQHWIDPDRVCLMGSSYGGYAALMGVLRDSERFRCAVSLAPVTELAEQIESYRRKGHRQAYLEWSYMVGGASGANDALSSVSPAYLADGLTRPVLLAHGAEDRSVSIDQSRGFLQRAPADLVRWLELPGEGHALVRQESRRAYYSEVARFLAEHLSPASSP